MRNKRPLALFGVSILCLAILSCAMLGLTRPQEKSYGFVTVDHPVDMWRDGRDQWAYYFVDMGDPSELATKARPELLAQGFKEDQSEKPWFKFVKGDQTVVVCDHGDFEVNGSVAGSKLAHNRFSHPGSSRSQCVLVKNGPGTHDSFVGFQVKKLLHGW